MARNDSNSQEPRRPTHNVYAVVETNDRDKPEKWVLVGAAWPGANDTFALIVDASPLPCAGVWRGKYVLQVRSTPEERRQSRQDDRNRR